MFREPDYDPYKNLCYPRRIEKRDLLQINLKARERQQALREYRLRAIAAQKRKSSALEEEPPENSRLKWGEIS